MVVEEVLLSLLLFIFGAVCFLLVAGLVGMSVSFRGRRPGMIVRGVLAALEADVHQNLGSFSVIPSTLVENRSGGIGGHRFIAHTQRFCWTFVLDFSLPLLIGQHMGLLDGKKSVFHAAQLAVDRKYIYATHLRIHT